jgi:glucosyl-dolichyl phosphate glucuronosyltransferase
MTVTVIVCTYNRCKALAHALDSVAASVLPASVEWEVLVVDNNSTDRTRDVVEGFRQRYPGRFRYVLEPRQGVSYARNTGVRESRGEVLAFMDDDVTVDPEWLGNLTSALNNGEWVGAGGRILPIWNSSPPSWVPVKERYGLAPLASFDLGPEGGPLSEPPFGANMAFKRKVFAQYGDFRTDLGRCANNLRSNEDTEFGRRLITRGEPLIYVPSAVVHHPVPPERLRKRYFLQFWFDKTRSDVLEFGIANGSRWHVAGIRLFAFLRLTRWIAQWMITLNSAKRFSCKLNVWKIAGEIVESYRSRHLAKKASASPI